MFFFLIRNVKMVCINVFSERGDEVRIKFDKEYLKYYTFAALGMISAVIFYHIQDNLGFVLSGAASVILMIIGVALLVYFTRIHPQTAVVCFVEKRNTLDQRELPD